MSSAANVDIIRESIITFISDSLDKVAAFVAFVYFANYFSTGEFGAAYTVIGMSMMAASVPKAVGVAVSKRVSENTSSRDRFFLIGAVATLTFGAIASLGGFLIVTLFETRFEVFALPAVIHLTTRPFLYIVERVFDGVGKTGFAASLDFVDGVLTALLRFVLILGFGFGADGLIYSGAMSAVAVGGTAYLWRCGFPTDLPKVDDVCSVREFSSRTIISRVSAEAFHNFPTVIAGTFISPTFASWVRSALTLTQPGKIPTRSVNQSIFVQVSGDTERGERDATPIQNGIDVTSIIAVPILAGAVILGDSLMVTMYGEGYSGTGFVLIAMATVTIFDSQSRIMLNTLNGSDNPDAVARANAINAILWGALLVTLATLSMPIVFLVGIILAYATWMVTNYWYLTDRVIPGDKLEWRFVVEQFLASAVMAVGVWVVRGMINYEPRAELAIGILTGAALYGTILAGISQRGRRIIRSVLDWIGV